MPAQTFDERQRFAQLHLRDKIYPGNGRPVASPKVPISAMQDRSLISTGYHGDRHGGRLPRHSSRPRGDPNEVNSAVVGWHTVKLLQRLIFASGRVVQARDLSALIIATIISDRLKKLRAGTICT
jgi:hypothetical protein